MDNFRADKVITDICCYYSQDGQWKSVGSLVETDGPADHATADHATTDRATDRPTAYGELVRVSRYIDAGSVASVR